MIRMAFIFCCCVWLSPCCAQKTVNLYIWGGEIPASILKRFTRTTGINVHVAHYDNNETLFAKLAAHRHNLYDVILPSAYFVERMHRYGLLEKLDKQQLPHMANLSAQFVNNAYDAENQYSIPLIWGATGIAYNAQKINSPPHTWRQLWSSRFTHQLMLLDDARDVFALALLSLHYSPNDTNPEHIKQAYQHLLALNNNIKLFASEGIQAMLIDEDVILASAWNGDVFKAQQENSAIQFIYPDDGFVIWVDCLAIPKHPPHLKEAYAFINFMLDAQTAAEVALLTGHAITNQAGMKRLPPAIRNNRLVYPDAETLKRGVMQRDGSETLLALYNHYWQALKLAL